MSHRALVAYERADGRYDLHRSRWGALGLGLVEGIGPAAPLGDGAVDPDPVAVGVTLEAIRTERVDPLAHEALYVVSPAFEVRAYLVLWYGLVAAGDPDPPARGALLAADPAGAEYDRGWFHGAAEVLGDLRAAGALTREGATARLEEALRRFAGEGRELLAVGPP